MSLNIGDYATVEGQLSKIIGVKHIRVNKHSPYITKIKLTLVGDNLTHWVNIKEVQRLPDQKAAKVLFNKKLSK